MGATPGRGRRRQMNPVAVRLLCLGVALLVFPLSARIVVACGAPLVFNASSLKGPWAFQMLPAKSFSASAPGDPGDVAGAPRQDILRVGVIDWFALPLPT